MLPKVPLVGAIWVEVIPGSHQSGASGFHQVNADSNMAAWVGTGLNTGTMVTVPPALALKQHKSVFSLYVPGGFSNHCPSTRTWSESL